MLKSKKDQLLKQVLVVAKYLKSKDVPENVRVAFDGLVKALDEWLNA